MAKKEQFETVIFTDKSTIQIERHSRRCCHKKGEPRKLKPKHTSQFAQSFIAEKKTTKTGGIRQQKAPTSTPLSWFGDPWRPTYLRDYIPGIDDTFWNVYIIRSLWVLWKSVKLQCFANPFVVESHLCKLP